MSLQDKIKNDLTTALKRGDALRLSTLRMLSAALHNAEIEKRSKNQNAELGDEEIVAVLRKEAKKRKEAVEAYTKGGRSDLREKEEAELAILEEYLPPEMSEGEITQVVERVIAGVESSSRQDFGKVMGAVMKELKGKADSSLVAEVVKKHIE